MPGDWGKGLSRPLSRAVHLLVPTCGKAVQEETQRERERLETKKSQDFWPKLLLSGEGADCVYFGYEIRNNQCLGRVCWGPRFSPSSPMPGLTVLNLSHAVKKADSGL